MLHMIRFLLVAPCIGLRLFLPISNQTLHQNMNLVLMSGLEELKKQNMTLLQIDIWYAIGKHNKTQRKKDLFRRDCKQKVVLDIILGTLKYVMSDFVEQHNHKLFSKGNMYLSHIKRKLNYSQEIFIHNFSKQNIGPVIAHRLYSAIQGDPSVQGGLVSDFKNARRNLNCYICGRDEKFLIDKMNDRKKNVPTFTFDYKVLKKRLNALFWADETTKYNYNSFGDVVSLDARCNMNKGGLLSKEDGVSYEWFLRGFLKAFRKQPKLVISKQDPALKKAIDNIFSLAHHRLCMWHITKKLPNKLEPHDFDNVWHMMLEEFKITDKNWMKTIHNQILNDFNTTTTFPKFITRIPNEPHASKISSSEDNCFQKNVNSSNGVDIIIVLEIKKQHKH
uniref:MULE transposase domain-containing protein n=1 Tax=Lactuca sativa TaxID=4236 RepID=A0A9R1UJT5_LACSA|nr:hypothetical protein LSAT_V11C900481740 [Lactuca sativa]